MSGPAEMLAVFPESPPPDLVRTLDLAGYRAGSLNAALKKDKKTLPLISP